LGATPVGFLTLGAFQTLSEKAELIFFDRSNGFKDWLAQGFRESAQDWVACHGLDPRALADQMRDKDLHAVIDCGGWTDIDALRALSLRPVTRQFKWVGGQALTTGLDCFDGYLADRWQVPKSSESLYREPIRRFEGPYITYVPPPYFKFSRGANAKPGVYALVSNPAKISASTLTYLKRLKPKRLLMIDHRWRYQHTRDRFMRTLQSIADSVEFIVPNSHAEYLETLKAAPATFVDTRPYSMGLTAIELLLMGKPIVGPRPRSISLMCERHSLGHQSTEDFAGYRAQAAQLLQWCSEE
jgi:predicted O-linked N-acetylglucosamine transferase (SPINDLY family)